MKHIKLKTRLFIINLLINLLLIGIPLIIFAAFNLFPESKNTTILYWVSFGLFPLINIIWFSYEMFKKRNEASVLFIQLVLNYLILVIPFINMIFALIPNDNIALFIVPLIIDIVAIVAYVSLLLLFGHVENKMEDAIEINKSIKVDAKPINEFENEDGTFKGSK